MTDPSAARMDPRGAPYSWYSARTLRASLVSWLARMAMMMVVDMPRMTNKATTMVNSWRSDLFMRCSLLVDRRQDSGYRNRRIGLIGLAGLAGLIGGHGMTCLPGCARMACPHGRDGRSLRRTRTRIAGDFGTTVPLAFAQHPDGFLLECVAVDLGFRPVRGIEMTISSAASM